ncbi:hypothetical protein NUW58_g5160 [Xylaria curta]|uniref:Uncharacterized protein n=1 Tax=Xylaria curta TaxID=42375 RepID=A0ACC1P326_9PEZI|nr:hypothetical protein NUW58_g5160 [Xylaria curta]
MLNFPTRAAFQLFIHGPAYQPDWDEFVAQWLGHEVNWKIREPGFNAVVEWFNQALEGNMEVIDESHLTYWCSIMLCLILRSGYEPSAWGINQIHSQHERCCSTAREERGPNMLRVTGRIASLRLDRYLMQRTCGKIPLAKESAAVTGKSIAAHEKLGAL